MMLTLYAFVNYFYFPYFISQLKSQISSTKLFTQLNKSDYAKRPYFVGDHKVVDSRENCQTI